MDWKQLVITITTVALTTNPKTRALAPFVATAVLQTEELFKTIPGEAKEVRNARKLSNAVGLVKTAIATNNELQPDARDIDPVVSDRLIASAISVVVDASNLIHKSPVATAA